MLNVTAARQHREDMRAQYMADGRKGSAAHSRYLEADAAWSAAVREEMGRYTTSLPAVAGDVVTQGHADYCKEYGHAGYTAAGEAVPWCARCGE